MIGSALHSCPPASRPYRVERHAGAGEDVGVAGVELVEADLDEVIEQHPVLAFGIIGRPRSLLAPAATAIAEVAEAHFGHAVVFEGAALTAAPRGLSKWEGVVAYCGLHGLDPGAALAVGDGPNDLELLDHASVAVVPEDAYPEALARADRVVAPPALGGWAQVLSFL